MDKAREIYSLYIEEHESLASLFNSEKLEKLDFDGLSTASEHVLNIQGYILSFNKELLRQTTIAYPENPWSWYRYSTFLRYYTKYLKKAFEAAEKSTTILSNNLEYSGAISRNYISLALQKGEYQKIDNEILYLSSNPNKKSQILSGVFDDISSFDKYEDVFSQKSKSILQRHKG